MASYYQSGLSSEPLRYPVTLLINGVATDPTSYPVAFAFMADDQAQPQASDWAAGSWEIDGTSGPQTPYVAVTPSIGPSGSQTSLTRRPAPYWPWLQITVASNNIHVQQLGPVCIT